MNWAVLANVILRISISQQIQVALKSKKLGLESDLHGSCIPYCQTNSFIWYDFMTKCFTSFHAFTFEISSHEEIDSNNGKYKPKYQAHQKYINNTWCGTNQSIDNHFHSWNGKERKKYSSNKISKTSVQISCRINFDFYSNISHHMMI